MKHVVSLDKKKPRYLTSFYWDKHRVTLLVSSDNYNYDSNENLSHDYVIKWKRFPRYWPFVRGINRSPMNSPHKGQLRGALMFSLVCAWINGWINNREAGDLRRYRAHYDVSVMFYIVLPRQHRVAFLVSSDNYKYDSYENLSHDDVIKWKRFLRYWSFVRGINRSPMNSPHKGQLRGALMFSLVCAWINGWINNREAGDLRRYRAHYDVRVMFYIVLPRQHRVAILVSSDTWTTNTIVMRTYFMMMSSNGNIFRVTGPLCGEFIGHRWIPRTKASDAELWCFLWSAPG